MIAERPAERAGSAVGSPAPMQHPVETFTADEQARLAPHFTNLDLPVFALVNLPETVKGALFARYSRYQGTLRRLFLDEFADSLPADGGRAWEGAEGERAAKLYETIFLGYGDDSVAQLGGAHVACEWVSNVLTKVLQRPRLGAYLEQSTRYIAYDAPMPGGGYRYYRDPELGPEYERAMDEIFSIYSAALPRVVAWADEAFPARRRRAERRAPPRDHRQGAGPAARAAAGRLAVAHGHLRDRPDLRAAHPAPPRPPAARGARSTAAGSSTRSRPSCRASSSRVERPDRGGEWVGYLEARERAAERWVARLGLDRRTDDGDGAAAAVGAPAARRRRRGGAAGRAAVRGRGRRRGDARACASPRWAPRSAPSCWRDLVGERANRRHRPGRGFEALRYRFEIVSDYGAFRDLQRHRMLTVQWQRLTPDLGAGVPEEVVAAGVRRGLQARAGGLARRLRAAARRRPRPRAAPVRAVPRLPHPLRARPQRARGDAAHRAALGPGGPSVLPRRRARDAPPDRRGPSGGRRRRCATSTRDTEPRLERILSEMRTQSKLDTVHRG